jgi:hypothetical protein
MPTASTPNVRWLLLGIAALFFPGCFHIHRKAATASEQDSRHIQFPKWGKDSMAIRGPELKALQIALDDFRPIGSKLSGNDDALVHCLEKIESYDVWVQRGEGMTFIHFTPEESERCGLTASAVDIGVSYAVGDDGVILKRD